jgi:hypothetical protein
MLRFIAAPAAALAGIALLRLGMMPPPPRRLFFDGEYPLHDGSVPPDILAHLFDIDEILRNETATRAACMSAWNDVLGGVRAFYMAFQTGEKPSVVKHIGKKTRELITRFEAYAAHSSFIHDIMQSLELVSYEILTASFQRHHRPPLPPPSNLRR